MDNDDDDNDGNSSNKHSLEEVEEMAVDTFATVAYSLSLKKVCNG